MSLLLWLGSLYKGGLAYFCYNTSKTLNTIVCEDWWLLHVNISSIREHERLHENVLSELMGFTFAAHGTWDGERKVKGLLLQFMEESINTSLELLTVTGSSTPEVLSLVNLQPTMHPEQNV